MPETYFHVRWPNGDEERCYSPSSVIRQYLKEGETYDLYDFVSITDQALNEASERVRAKYGFACSSASDQLHRIKHKAAKFEGTDERDVLVNQIT